VISDGLDDEKTALELVPVADDETASLDLAQFLEWIARLVLECSWLNEQRGYSTPTLQVPNRTHRTRFVG
jgi:hypothetical protein